MKEKDAYDRMAVDNAEVRRLNRRLQQLHQQMEYELQLAQRIQSSFLPKTMPEVQHARFGVRYLGAGRAGGDFHDIFRVDGNHVALYVADAMGHGIPASLLTFFVKNALQAQKLSGTHSHLLSPDDVLQRLNKELLERDLPEHPFLTMCYAVYNHADSSFYFARAGHPYPLYVPRTGEPIFWRQEGLLLGVTETTFPARSYPLTSGDKVLLYSDGIDGGRFGDHSLGADSLLVCAEHHRHRPVQPFLDCLTRELFACGEQSDDLTLLALEVL